MIMYTYSLTPRVSIFPKEPSKHIFARCIAFSLSDNDRNGSVRWCKTGSIEYESMLSILLGTVDR